MITGSRGSTYSGASFTATKAGSSMGTIRSRGSSVSKPRRPIFRNVKFVSQHHSVFSRTARDRSAASSIFHSDPGTDLPVASGSVAADVSAPSGVGISTASATGTSVGVGDGSNTCAAAGTASPLAGEPATSHDQRGGSGDKGNAESTSHAILPCRTHAGYPIF